MRASYLVQRRAAELSKNIRHMVMSDKYRLLWQHFEDRFENSNMYCICIYTYIAAYWDGEGKICSDSKRTL